VSGGQLAGASSDGVRSFRNIPFAAPPVGDLRWKPPVKPSGWSGVRDATVYGAACPQPDRTDGGGAGRFDKQSEDCLTLNVWTTASSGQKLPVMVWIHGGAHRLGSGVAPLYDGTELAKQGVVLVTLNYRLGLLGFFAHPAVTADAGPDAMLGNYGLMDQIAALGWVQDNIARFGGDPDNVTVFGESAGAADILYLLSTPAAKGLFDKAVVESGGGTQRPSDLAAQEQQGVKYAAAAGFGADASLADLKGTPATAWIEAQGELQGGLGFGPFIDGRLIREAPWRVFQDGREIDVPLMIGANSNEASVLTTLGVPSAALAVAMDGKVEDLRAAYGSPAQQEFLRQAMGDLVFVAPSRWVAAQATDGAPSFLYYFSYLPTVRRGRVPGAGHGTEIPFIFKSWGGTPIERFLSDEDKAMATRMSACWVAFAKNGDPCGDLMDWPAYDAARDQLLEFGETVGVRKPPHAAALDLMNDAFLKATAARAPGR